MSSTPSPATTRRSFVLAAVALVGACLGAYATGLRGPFLMDDFDALFPLAAAQSSGLDWWDVLRNAPSHIRDRWLANLSFLVSHALGGGTMPPDTFPYKLGNLIVHLACGAATWLLAARLAGRWGASPARAYWIALMAAGLFLLHPLLVSTVLYPVQRMAQLSTLFLLLSMHAYVRWRSRIDVHTPASHAIGLTLVAAHALLAYLAKENGALAPLLLMVVEFTAFRWPAREAPGRSRFETGFGLLCLAPMMLGLALLALRWERTLAGYARRDFSMAERMLTQVHVLFDYLGQILWPRIAGMGLYRDDFPLRTTLDAGTIAIGALFALSAGLAIWGRRRWPALAFGVLWFFAAHALESTIIALELVFEHRNYLALFGPALAVSWTLGTWKGRLASGAIAGALLLALCVQTGRRAADWADYERWITSESAHHPRSVRAGTDHVMYLLQRQQEDAALRRIDSMASVGVDPAHVSLLRLAAQCRTGIPTDANVPLHPFSAARISKDLYHLFSALVERREVGACEGLPWPTLAEIASRIAVNPALADQRTARAAWHRHAARVWIADRQWTKARTQLEAALAQRRNDPRDWMLLAELSARLGDRAGFVQARAGLVRLMPTLPPQFSRDLARWEAAIETRK